ncbi:MAG: 30S ribosomal protein S20 [Spirochaetaceae bacterium]|nr:30S ribosomal protein S20 [Spirochaetaceae bacterium]
MALKKSSAEKRHKQSEVRRLRNKAAKSSARTSVRKYLEAVQAKDAALAADKLKLLCKEYDTAAGKGIITKNAAARKKSRMMKLYNVTFNAAAAN